MDNHSPFHKWIPYNGSIENPIVFIHGFLESHTIWSYLPLGELKRPVLLVDVPGFGKSNLFDDNIPSIRYFADELDALFNSYDINQYDLVGHSMGGYIGLELLKISDKIQKLVLLNSNFWADSNSKKTDRTRVADILLKNKDLFVSEAIPNLFLHPEKHLNTIKKLIAEAKSGTPEWYAYASLAMRERIDFTDFIKENSNRFEVVQGEKDALIPTEKMQKKCKGWKDIKIVSESGHMSLFEQPQEVISILKTIL
jgi:pimeloyl-ACP methyl ester carboxylesterase